MKFNSEKTNLLKAINSVINGISNKRDSILEGILIKAENDQVIFTTYNEEIGIEYVISADVETPGNIVVTAATFAEIIRKLPDTLIQIRVEEENNLLVIECEGSSYKLATMNANEFPQIPQITPELSLEIQQKELKTLIKQVIFAVSTDDKRPIYTGCLFNVEDQFLSIVALDGFRLAIRKVPVVCSSDFKMIIPGKTLTEVSKIISDSFDGITIGFSNNQAVFMLENCKITTKLLEGTFLKYQDLLNAEPESRVKINRNALLDSFERATLISASSLSKEKKEPIDIKLEIGKMTLSCISGVGIAKEELEIDLEGKEINNLKFNPKYFLDILKNISEEEIMINFGNSKSASMIVPVDKQSEEFWYIILPIKSRD